MCRSPCGRIDRAPAFSPRGGCLSGWGERGAGGVRLCVCHPGWCLCLSPFRLRWPRKTSPYLPIPPPSLAHIGTSPHTLILTSIHLRLPRDHDSSPSPFVCLPSIFSPVRASHGTPSRLNTISGHKKSREKIQPHIAPNRGRLRTPSRRPPLRHLGDVS